MRKHLISMAGTAIALVFAGGAHAQLLGGNVAGGVTGGVTGGAADLGLGARGGLGADVGAAAGVGETVGAVARVPAGVDATVRGGAFPAQPGAAVNAAARTGVGLDADASLPAQADVRAQGGAYADTGAYAPRRYDHGEYVYVESRGWVWVPRGARLNADGTVSVATDAAVDTVTGAAAGLNAGARISGGLSR